jgi:hypothetical protein
VRPEGDKACRQHNSIEEGKVAKPFVGFDFGVQGIEFFRKVMYRGKK